MALLEEARGELVQGLGRVTPGALDWEPLPGSRTIGEALLHIAGLELLLSCAVAPDAHAEAAAALWPDVEPGFAAEAGYAPPRGFDVAHYLSVLEDTRGLTRLSVPGGREVHVDLEAVRQVVDSLVAHGALDPKSAGVIADVAEAHLGVGSVGVVLATHEAYHRGQLLLLNFLASRHG